jgi:hypothetical protein
MDLDDLDKVHNACVCSHITVRTPHLGASAFRNAMSTPFEMMKVIGSLSVLEG